MTKETRTDIQIYSAIAMLLAGVALAAASSLRKTVRTFPTSPILYKEAQNPQNVLTFLEILGSP